MRKSARPRVRVQELVVRDARLLHLPNLVKLTVESSLSRDFFRRLMLGVHPDKLGVGVVEDRR